MEVKFDEAVSSKDFRTLESSWRDFSEIELADKKLAVDHLLRKKVIGLLASNSGKSKDDILDIISFSFEAATRDFCSRSSPVALLSDVFDSTAINKCEELFYYVEDKIPHWKSEIFFDTCKNHLLRMCNDLLRRLSRTTDTGFCGRILVFLARCLPLTEKSGLNLTSQFNSDNVTKFDSVENSTESSGNNASGDSAAVGANAATGRASTCEVMDVEEGEMDENAALNQSIPVDYNLYCKFWQLQSYFSSPLTCYDKFGWKKFLHNATEVLNAFSSHKLDDVAVEGSPRKKVKSSVEMEFETPIDEEKKRGADQQDSSIYFAKYLTSQKLLQLQLNDNNFRRYVLVQFLILFQYLTSDVKFKDKKLHSLNEEQAKFVEETNEKCYALLQETYPDGKRFSTTVKHILEREEYWNSWKNAGCEDFTKRADKERPTIFKRRAKQRAPENTLDLGNPILTKLWNTCPDNFEACRASERQFVPNLEAFLEEPFEQMKPENQIEAQLVNDENFQWRALRLLAMKTTHFYVPAVLPHTNASLLLNTLIMKAANDIPKYADQMQPKGSDKPTSANDNAAMSNDVQLEQEIKTQTSLEEEAEFQAERQAENLVTDDQIVSLSALIGADWPKLATELEMAAEFVDSLKKKQVSEDACSVLLTNWSDKEGAQATVKRLRNLLLQAELFNEDVASVLHRTTEDTEVASTRSETEETYEEEPSTPLQDEAVVLPTVAAAVVK